MKKFRLLRSNKESGPYSADELICMGLKAYDLIWIENKSAAWRYPCEIDELKAYAPAVEEQPFDRFYRRQVTTTIKIEENKTDSQVQTVTVSAVKEKPRIRVSAAWNRIEPVAETMEVKTDQPVQKVQQTFVQQINTSQSPSWQNAWLDWEQEKKTVASSSKSSEVNSAPAPKEPVIKTKFSQSLDDIKERYIETVLQSKSANINYKNFLLTAFLVVVISCIGYGLWHEWNSKDETSNALLTTPKADNNEINRQQAEQTVTNVPNDQQQQTPDSKAYIVPVREKSSSTDLAQASKKEVIKNQPEVPASNKQKNTKTDQTKSKNVITTGSNQSLLKQPVTYAAANTPTKQNTSSNVKSASETGNKTSSLFSSMSKSENIQDFVAVDAYNPSSSGSVENVSFNVQNISDIPIDLVVMDLQYFDGNGGYRKGETVYMKNIAPGKTITVKAPDDKLSGKVTYKVSLVSAPQKDIYLIAD